MSSNNSAQPAQRGASSMTNRQAGRGILRLLPLLALIGGLFLTQQLWQGEHDNSLQRLRNDFDFRVHESAAFIERRMGNHMQGQRAFQGVFLVHEELTGDEFRRYVEALGVKGRYPGVRTIAYVQYVPAERKRQAEGSHSLSIQPPGERAGYAPVLYSEAQGVPEPDAIGLDIYAAEHSRAAMDQARDSGRPTVSDKVMFPDGPGFVMYGAVFSNGELPKTAAERRARLVGWAMRSFNMQRLMEDVLGQPFADIDIEIYDGEKETVSPSKLLYDSAPGHQAGMRAAMLHDTLRLDIAGHPWTVTYSSLPQFEARLDEAKASAIAVGGMLASLSLALTVWLLLHGRDLALEQASRMTRKLEQNERRYRLMFEDNASMSCLIDQQTGRLVDVNPAAAAYWGYAREELLGMTIFDINAERRDKVADALNRLRTDGRSMQRETRHRLKSGEVREVEVFAGLLDYDGQPVCHVTFHDIGNRRKIEMEQIRSLTDGYPVAVVVLDMNGVIRMANPAAERTFRCSREQLVGQHSGTLVPERVRARYGTTLAEYMRDPQPLEVDERRGLVAIRRDGEEFPVELRLAPFKMGGRTVVILSIYDVTTRKQAEQALRKLERAVEQTSVSIVITDAKGIIEYVNPVFSEVSGYTREEAIGQNPRLLQSGETSQQAYQNLWTTITGGGVWKGQLRNRRKNGELFWEEVSISPVFDEAGAITNYIAVKEDISERKRIEADLKQAKEAAEAASRAKSDFLAMISHEIRTPMNGVIGLTALLQETMLDPEQQKYAATLKQSAESLLFFINDILDFSKIEAGKLDVEVIDFDLRVLLDHLHAMLAFRAREKKLEFTIWVDPNVPSLLRGDPGRLRQILLNLLSNAIKFTGHGQVVLHVDLRAGEGAECRLHFEVRDTGIGIPADKQSLLFTPFTQVDSSTTRRYGGTGLGLAISKQLVELMGGEIGVISPFPPRVGGTAGGSAFWFDLDFERQTAVDHAPVTMLGDLGGRRILVLNGMATPRTVLDLLLVEWQCTAYFASSDSEALAQLRALHAMGQPADAMIIDAQSAEVDVIGVAQSVRGDADLALMPLVVLSSAPQRGDGKRMKAAGVSAYLPKPVNSATLFNCLRHVIGDVRVVTDPAHPLITQYTLAESERRARILLIAAQGDGEECRLLAREMHDKLGHQVEVVADDPAQLEALGHAAGAHRDLVLFDRHLSESGVFDLARRIRGGGVPPLERDVPLVAVVGEASAETRQRARAAGLSEVLGHPVDALLLDRVIVQALRNRSEPTAMPMVFAGRNPRLLLAEDNPVNQMVALGLLRKLGIQDVVVVENGLEALETVSRGDFDLVLMDCQMPVMDGFAATRALRDLGCKVPVIAVTAHSMTGIQERCMAAGMSEWVAKPIDFAEFASTLTRWLGPTGMGAAPAPAAAEAAQKIVVAPVAAVESEPAEHACFERAVALERLRGDAALLGELIRVFLTNWPLTRKRLEDALAAGDVAVATRESHTLKGSAMTVGAGRAGEVAMQINEAGKLGQLAEMQRLMPELVREVDGFMTAAKTLESST